MSSKELVKIEAMLEDVLKELKRRAEPLPSMLSQPDAARELNIGMTKLRQLIARGTIIAVKYDDETQPKVPRSEIERLATVRLPSGLPVSSPSSTATASLTVPPSRSSSRATSSTRSASTSTAVSAMLAAKKKAAKKKPAH